MLLTRARPLCRGYTMIELMVAMTIGLLILAGLATVFASNSRARNEIERANQQVENGRYALDILANDLRNAGYLGIFNPGTLSAPNVQLASALPGSPPDACSTALATLRTALPLAVQGYYQGTNLPASCAALLNDRKPATDVLVVRRASTCAVGSAGCDPPAAGAAYFQASACSTELATNVFFVLDTDLTKLTLHQKDCVTIAPYYQWRTHVYFIARDDQPQDGIPTLKRAELGVAAGALAFTIVPLAEGIESLHLEYGLDTNAPTSGAPAAYAADPNTWNGCAPAVCAGYWWNAVAAKLYVLARNLGNTPGYTDRKQYVLGLQADGVTPYALGPFGDGLRRHVYTSVVRVNNVAGRNAT